MKTIKFGELLLKWEDANLWSVHDRFQVLVDGSPIWVPTGFHTDLASIPPSLWRLLSPMGAYTPAAVFHDYLYKLQPVSKETADILFRDGMLCLGVDEETVEQIYTAVKLFGHGAWDEHSVHLQQGVLTPYTTRFA